MSYVSHEGILSAACAFAPRARCGARPHFSFSLDRDRRLFSSFLLRQGERNVCEGTKEQRRSAVVCTRHERHVLTANVSNVSVGVSVGFVNVFFDFFLFLPCNDKRFASPPLLHVICVGVLFTVPQRRDKQNQDLLELY